MKREANNRQEERKFFNKPERVPRSNGMRPTAMEKPGQVVLCTTSERQRRLMQSIEPEPNGWQKYATGSGNMNPKVGVENGGKCFVCLNKNLSLPLVPIALS